MQVSQLMSHEVVSCRPDDTLASVAAKMLQYDVGALPVCSPEGRLVAMITDRDMCMAANAQGRPFQEMKAAAAMSLQVFTCEPTFGLIDAAEIMQLHQVRRLPVVDRAGAVIGMLSLSDMAKEARREFGRRFPEMKSQDVTATLAIVGERRRSSGRVVA